MMKKLLFKFLTITVLLTLVTTFALVLFVLALTAPIEKNTMLDRHWMATPTGLA